MCVTLASRHLNGPVPRLALFALAWFGICSAATAASVFTISHAKNIQPGPLNGRLIVAVSSQAEPEPRTGIASPETAIFGADVEALAPAHSITIDADSPAYPIDSLSRLPAGDYYVQAVLVRYDKVRRADGHSVWIPLHPERVPFTQLQGNLYSDVRKVHLDPQAGFDVPLVLSKTVAAPTAPKETQWIKYVRIQSDLLTKFWGTPMYLGAYVLLPQGFAEHPNARYPVVYAQSHGTAPYHFNPNPQPEAGEEEAARTSNIQTGHDFYTTWNSEGFPRFVVAALTQPSPYFLEGYSVDSANNGPYGEAITKELIPAIEKRFRGIGQPYARIVQGASTGGWESLALQLKYPDFFGGAWVFNPDPIDFHHYGQVDIYKDSNAFAFPLSPLLSQERPFRRTVEGQPTMTMRDLSRLESVLGSHGRSAFQLEAWESVYGPVGADGYPVPLWDKRTGAIDHSVADYMREHDYDLTDYARRNWATLGPALSGKLNFISGEMDNFYLNLGVYAFEDMLKGVAGADYKARFVYGRPKKGHGWHHVDFSQMIREMGSQVESNAPAGADVRQWHY